MFKHTKPRSLVVLLLVVLIVIFTASTALASVLDSVLGKFKDVSLGFLVSIVFNGVFGILALVFGAAVTKYKKVSKEGLDCALWLIESTSEKSEGGKKITQTELEEGVKEFGEFGQELSVVISSGK